MKKLISVVIIAILIVSCNEKNPNMVTKINPDGTCYREFSEKTDTSFILGDTTKNPFPVKLDSSWKISWSYNSSSGVTKNSEQWPLKHWTFGKDTAKYKFIRTKARRNYTSVEELGEKFRFNNSEWNSIVPKVEFSKKFKWFFTFYNYKEIYPKYNPTIRVPVSKYLTNDEISMFFGDNPKFSPSLNGAEIKESLDRIDKKKEEWLTRVVVEDCYNLISKNLYLLKGFTIDSVTFMAKKDSIINSLDLSKDPDNQLIKKLDKFFKTNAFSKLDKEEPEKLNPKNNISELIIKPFSMYLTYSLIMPGRIVETNSKRSQGDTLTWKVDANRFFFTDYTIYAESRVANIWAFVVSGLFILGVVLSFFIKRKK